MTKQDLIDAALDQILYDVEIGDLTALEELLSRVPEQYLQGYLPEDILG